MAVVSEASVETVVPLANGVVMHVVEVKGHEEGELKTTAAAGPVFR